MFKFYFIQTLKKKSNFIVKKKNKSQLNTISPIFFNKKAVFHSGKKKMSRTLHFFHNNLKIYNLFLTKKIKPQPIFKKK